ncbi:MAG TPA: hypothetical protein DCX59_02960 [Candidatus Pacebacteria bacterium]|nr:hypothetical protein [Candidatus Paceibacterota bacterium]
MAIFAEHAADASAFTLSSSALRSGKEQFAPQASSQDSQVHPEMGRTQPMYTFPQYGPSGPSV